LRTFSPRSADITRRWLVIDAEGAILGRMSTEIATLLRGKHKPIYTPHLDTGDHVIVVNAAKIVLTSDKSEKKFVYHHSGYPGGLTKKKYGELLSERPEEVVRRAVRGMLPRTRLGRQQLLKLKVYAGPDHPHQAQLPEPLDLPGARARS
jgi:large subunit ribosomal protein L13